MRLEARDADGARVIRLGEPRLDAAGAIAFKDGIRELATDAPARLILDLSEVEFLDSSGLGAVVAAMKLLAPERQLELAGVHGAVEKVLRLTRMDRVFTIHPDAPGTAGQANAT